MPETLSNLVASGTPRTQAERTALAETRMVLAAIDLLNEVGVNGTTLVAIGDKAGYSRGLATHHFGTKAGLFTIVLKRISAAWSKVLERELGDKTGLAAVTTAIDAHLRHIMKHPKYLRAQNILWGLSMDPSSEFKPNVAEFMQIQRESVAGWVRNGQRQGDIAPTINPDLFAAHYYGGLVGITTQWLVSPDFDLSHAYEDFKNSVVQLLAHGDQRGKAND